jgi:quinolinate synthase
MQNLITKIKELKKRKNAVVLAHCYQNMEIDLVADYVGDSLGLSQLAAKTDAEIIVFAGVFFMAQTAKILSPNKKVLLPKLESGCQMADMIDEKQLVEFKAKHPDAPVVCYVNSTAEVKAHADVCCTSSNAVDAVRNLGADKILFVPDAYLGSWVQKSLPEVEVVCYPGFCPTHLMITTADIEARKLEMPGAKVVIHPECHQSVVARADFVGSTTQIMEYCKAGEAREFIIGTEIGVVERLTRDCPEKKFTVATEKAYCHNMKWHGLEDILRALEDETHEITLDEALREKAFAPIQKMLG